MADPKTTIVRTFEYKLRTNKTFIAACERELEHSRQIYNAALAERISAYRIAGKSLNFVAQSRSLTEARTLPEVKAHLRTIQSDALERLDEAFQAFFRRLKRGEKPGYPRFKGRMRYHTFALKYEAQRQPPLSGDKLKIPGVGTCRIRLSRPLEGRVKQIRITRRESGWFALLVCEMAKPEPLPKTGRSTGVDVGLKTFATLSHGEPIENPLTLLKTEAKLKGLHKRLSRQQRGSQRRNKQRRKVALAHLKVARTRRDFLHQATTKLVREYDALFVEKLNIRGMVRNRHLAKAIADVSWGTFFTMLREKAERAGRQFEAVNPRYTSQTCSRCGGRQPMPLSVRVFKCASCGHTADRDKNAAENIRMAGQAKTQARGDGALKAPRRSGNAQTRHLRRGPGRGRA
jgi:putative transposase